MDSELKTETTVDGGNLKNLEKPSKEGSFVILEFTERMSDVVDQHVEKDKQKAES
jgi:hypothetical protein